MALAELTCVSRALRRALLVGVLCLQGALVHASSARRAKRSATADRTRRTSKPRRVGRGSTLDLIQKAVLDSFPTLDQILGRHPDGAALSKLTSALSTSGSIYDQPAFHAHFARRPAAARALLARYWGRSSDRLVARIERTLGPRYLPLALDPGIVTRFDAFMRFAVEARRRDPKISAFGLRTAFSAHLGTRRVYRGLALTPAVARRVKRQGLVPAAMRDRELARRIVAAAVTPPDPAHRASPASGRADPAAQLDIHIGAFGGDPLDTYQSVTSYPELAAGVASGYTGKGQEVYVVELDIPEISIIDRVGPFAHHVDDTTVRVHDKEDRVVLRKPARDKGIESFVAHRIRPGWIRAVTRIAEPPEFRN